MFGPSVRKNMLSLLPSRALSYSTQTYSIRFKQINADQLKKLIESGAYLHGRTPLSKFVTLVLRKGV